MSQDLCYAALSFASDNLKHNGHFVCKFYAGAEDKLLKTKLQKLFQHVHREKPDSSRKVRIGTGRSFGLVAAYPRPSDTHDVFQHIRFPAPLLFPTSLSV